MRSEAQVESFHDNLVSRSVLEGDRDGCPHHGLEAGMSPLEGNVQYCHLDDTGPRLRGGIQTCTTVRVKDLVWSSMSSRDHDERDGR